MAESAESYVVHYFNVRGRAEPIRMILSHIGANWKDERITEAHVPEKTKEMSTFAQVPLLEVENSEKRLAQTMAICRYLAARNKLNGVDAWESAKCDEIAESVVDFDNLFADAYYEKDAAKKKAILDKGTAVGRERYINNYNRLLAANGGHLVGSKLTYADIVVANSIHFVESLYHVDLTNGYPVVKEFLNFVFNQKGIKEWIVIRPDTVV